jgi:hypothetical protein
MALVMGHIARAPVSPQSRPKEPLADTVPPIGIKAMRLRSAVAALAFFSAIAPGRASAQGLCVECRAPDRTYSCSVKDSERVSNVRGASKALEFLCASEIARSNRHESCRVGTSFSGPCIGEPFEIDVARLGTDATSASPPLSQSQSGPSPATSPAVLPAQPAKTGPPKTLEELARNTVAKSKEHLDAADEGVRRAGNAVGDSLKKTWDCVVSLFSRC